MTTGCTCGWTAAAGVTVTAPWPAGGPAGDAAARDGEGAGCRLCAGRALPVPRPARLLFAAGAREPIWLTCQAAIPPVVSRATAVTMAVIVIPWPGDSRNRRSGRTASPVSGGLAPGWRVTTAAIWSSAAGCAVTAQGGVLPAQGALSARGGVLAGQGASSGSRDGWRAGQEGSAGGSRKDQGETGVLTGRETDEAACGSHADGGLSSGPT